jgi:hypothetical protein
LTSRTAAESTELARGKTAKVNLRATMSRVESRCAGLQIGKTVSGDDAAFVV